MFNKLATLSSLAILMLCTTTAQATVMSSLAATTTVTGSGTSLDPFLLNAGDSIQVDVNLSGVTGSGITLDYLGVAVSFDALSFDQPVSASYGPIVLSSLLGTPGIGPGTANGLIDVSGFGDQILNEDGLFFTFTLTAQSLAATQDSTISITSADFIDLNLGTIGPMDIGNPIYVTVLANSTATVPEPASLTVFGLGAAGLLWYRRRR